MRVDITVSYNSTNPQYSIYNQSAKTTLLGVNVAGDKLETIKDLFHNKAKDAVREMRRIVGRSDRNEPGKVHLADTIHYRVTQRTTSVSVKIWTYARHAVFVEYGTIKTVGKYFFKSGIIHGFGDIIPHSTLIRGISTHVHVGK